jgi:hypothetical protein
VFATVNRSACSWSPIAETSKIDRAYPVALDSRVPSDINALERTIDASGGCPTSVTARPPARWAAVPYGPGG